MNLSAAKLVEKPTDEFEPVDVEDEIGNYDLELDLELDPIDIMEESDPTPSEPTQVETDLTFIDKIAAAASGWFSDFIGLFWWDARM